MGFPGGSEVKNPPVNAGDAGLIPQSGRSPGEGNGNPLHNSCPGNPIDGGAWGRKELDTTEQLTLSLLLCKVNIFTQLTLSLAV